MYNLRPRRYNSNSVKPLMSNSIVKQVKPHTFANRLKSNKLSKFENDKSD